MIIRNESTRDHNAVRAINTSAFETAAEASLVDTLRAAVTPIVSLVAQVNNNVIGHILFTPVTLSGHPNINIMGLGPMAVAPEHQRMAVGSALVAAGLDACRQRNADAAIVLGHPEFYPRFGFQSSSQYNIDCEFDVPPEVFMAMELKPGALEECSGTIHYHDAFQSV